VRDCAPIGLQSQLATTQVCRRQPSLHDRPGIVISVPEVIDLVAMNEALNARKWLADIARNETWRVRRMVSGR